jgi:Tol biopolymer transport system component
MLAGCIAIVSGCESSPTEPEERVEKIAFYSRRDGQGDIYIMRADGTEMQRLTHHPATDFEPAISPDGSRIAFTSARDGNLELYVMGVDGSGLTRLTADPADDDNPAWSPDGRYLAFASIRGWVPMLQILDLSTGQITAIPGAEGRYPDWSPDGTLLVYNGIENGRAQIFIVRPDGTGRRRLSDGIADDFDPDWSPDGRFIAFEEYTPQFGSRIVLMRADGSDRTALTTELHGSARAPEWSPNGQRIAFHASKSDEASEIYTISLDGRDVRQLTHHQAHDGLPSWR